MIKADKTRVLQSTGSSLSRCWSLRCLHKDFLLKDLLGHGFVTFLISDIASAGPLKPSWLVARALNNITLKH